MQPRPTQYRCKKANLPQIPGLTRTANGGHATVAVDCRDSRTSYPRRNGYRCARRWVSTGPVTQRCYTPVRPHGPPGPVGTNRTVGKKPSQLKEVNSTSVERMCTRITLGLLLCGAAVHASLAPAQPPPPAGLASDPACNYIIAKRKKTKLCVL